VEAGGNEVVRHFNIRWKKGGPASCIRWKKAEEATNEVVRHFYNRWKVVEMRWSGIQY
jgi:hypothetical protein